MGNGNSKGSKSKVHHGQRAKVGSSELLSHHVPRVKTEPVVVVGFPTNEGSLRLKGHSEEEEQYGKKSSSLLDNDDTFTEFIRHVKYKTRNFSNIGREQSNPAPEPEPETNKYNENQKDQFDDFIKVSKKKLKTTSRVGKNSSFRD
ncbi:hypothetical protein TanjilG_02978 [Lupinus angustifolius]|uniref:Uncharacterized protein n=1 Tax=Lupinus angustifolius TaxID=3871 RepID=A0A4P1RCJ1_LUPAN|nr:hypothetical protein TanjilG_02978 [Lupinus angustifolius]